MKELTTHCIDEGRLRTYMDGELPEVAREAVVEHLALCERCRRSIEAIEVLTSQTVALLSVPSHAPDTLNALERLKRGQAGRIGLHPALKMTPESVHRVTNILEQRRSGDMKKNTARPSFRIGLAFAFAIALLALGGITLLNRPAPASAAEVLDKTHQTTTTIPEGKVRHIVTSITTTRSDGTENTTTIEDWLATENGRQLARSTGPYKGSSMVADGTAVWISFDKAKTVHKLSTNYVSFGGYVSNRQMVEEMLKLPDTTLVGKSTINGREVIMIEGRGPAPGTIGITSTQQLAAPEGGDSGAVLLGPPVSLDMGDTPPEPVDGSIYYPVDGSIYYRLWVDSQTYQIVQQEFGVISLEGKKQVRATHKVLLDELEARSDSPQDLFTFKVPEGFKVVEMADLPEPGIERSIEPGFSGTPVP